jgi:hypothetical protein
MREEDKEEKESQINKSRGAEAQANRVIATRDPRGASITSQRAHVGPRKRNFSDVCEI